MVHPIFQPALIPAFSAEGSDVANAGGPRVFADPHWRASRLRRGLVKKILLGRTAPGRLVRRVSA